MLITIGSFDGFHKGHAELFRLCREHAVNNQWGVVSFYPHPAEYMHRFPHSLFSLRERELIRRVLDVPNMYILEFNEALRTSAPSEFWRLTRERFGVDGLVMGRDFHFGVNREGTAEYLSRLAHHDGVSRIYIADLLDKPKYSSSNARYSLAAGNVEEVMHILGYPCFMMGRITHGLQRGRTMHFPTANIDISGRLAPSCGVYCSAVLVNDSWHCGAVSIGSNPTFHDVSTARLEVYILDFEGDIYGEELPVFFLGRVRDMQTFPNTESLIAQITHDTQTCREIYAAGMSESGVKAFMTKAKDIYQTNNLTPEVIRLV